VKKGAHLNFVTPKTVRLLAKTGLQREEVNGHAKKNDDIIYLKSPNGVKAQIYCTERCGADDLERVGMVITPKCYEVEYKEIPASFSVPTEEGSGTTAI
jgi:hypothetical protein